MGRWRTAHLPGDLANCGSGLSVSAGACPAPRFVVGVRGARGVDLAQRGGQEKGLPRPPPEVASGQVHEALGRKTPTGRASSGPIARNSHLTENNRGMVRLVSAK